MRKLKTILWVASALILALLGLGPSEEITEILFTQCTYFIILILFICWVLRLVSEYARQWQKGFRLHWPALLLSLVLVGLIFLISPPKFKTLTDETNLIGVSMMMHENKTAAKPIEGIYTDFAPPSFLTHVDKRPVLFPFLVSLIHSLFGYSPYNGFILNFIIGCALLFIMYLSVSRVLTRSYGLLSILLFASAPIFVVYVTSSGFEVLNAFFLVFGFLLLIDVHERQDSVTTTELLLLTLLLLAQCRYESLIILLVFLVILAPLLQRQKYFRQMTFLSCLMPLFLLPIIWQRILYINIPEINKIEYNLYHKLNSPFSIKTLIQNIDDNIYVMLGIDPNWGFSIILSALAISGLYMVFKNLILKKDIILQKPVFTAGLASFGVLLCIISAFYWGKFTIPADSRLALVFLPFIVWMGIYCIYQICSHTGMPPATSLALLCVFHLMFYWPYGAVQRVSNAMALPYVYRSTLAYLNENYDNRSNTMILTEHPNMYIIHKYSAYRIDSIDKMIKALPESTIEHIVALQSFNLKSGEIAAKSRLNGPIESTMVEQIVITSFSGVKISECHFSPDMDSLNEQNMPPLRDKQL